jgi:hypothetical protein
MTAKPATPCFVILSEAQNLSFIEIEPLGVIRDVSLRST